MARGGPRLMDQISELHRSLRRKKGGDLSMKQAACSFGGLFGFIFLLQYFDLTTLAVLGVLAYIIYRYFQGAFELPLDEEDTQQKQEESPEDRAANPKGAKAKSKSKSKTKKS
mmetsp:Transcript_63358/g.137913  ORF Transcript_63358/g.137913 Transcript_63358/m.137913 type:complete len:113 (-) Transcript_63358:277-615(-)|eukprot:CAMPEP_0170620986 /NCGR_PEP_ID=MMETSP0224-20130122/28359_1 /TAXON_ID=285029 /ORGANISM="Togula jolla, Strain CCCM 725" /LENGTH=112 /DNA_ID=CAMNT_0010947213 /DNA_START=80 /DNA_END=418 /DNA_ORIENTATION=+